MPLEPGKSQGAISRNISELHTGKTYAKTKKKFGPKKAHKQSVAIAMSKAREAAPIPGAGHNPPKPKFAEDTTREGNMIVPRHMHGRGLISPKAMLSLGKKHADAAQPSEGQHLPAKAGHAKPGMSPTGKHAAKAARPPKGQHKPAQAKPSIGTHVARVAPADTV